MSAQQSIAHYRIVAKLGEGGMGAVYRATDTKLNRDVAIKVLPEAFAQDAARMQRFEREAQVLASLNHPNIAAIYGIEQGAIVMELVEGDDLKGPVPLDTALDYARQIAAGLEAAHEKGIVHRDLKPANIRVTPDGTVKLLDFGLAKATEASAASAGATQSPTLSLAMTQAGMILGTAAYMSPEQARGKPVDKRADIWAFGVVLYELLTGAALFGGGETISDALAAVITQQPDLSAVPASVRPVLQACLEKDPRQRLRDIGDWRRLVVTEAPAVAPAGAPSRSRLRFALIVAIASGVAAAGGWLMHRAPAPPRPLIRASIDIPEQDSPGPVGHFWPILSPDGGRIAFAGMIDGKIQLAVRTLDQPKFTPLPDTGGASQPFFSPDGRSIAFFADGQLKKISVEGGAAVTICNAPSPRGGSWGENGDIVAVLQTKGGLMRISSAGGTPQPLVQGQPQESTDTWPQFLPGGQAVLCTAGVGDAGPGRLTYVAAIDLSTGTRKKLRDRANYGRYSSSGHLLFHRENVILAAPMNLARLELTGPEFPVQENVPSALQGSAEYDVAGNGSMVYRTGRGLSADWSIFKVDREGKTTPLSTPPRRFITGRLSPDGQRMAVTAVEGNGAEIFLYDLRRDALQKLTSLGNRVDHPVWTPDGRFLVFASNAGGVFNLYAIRSDASTPPVRLTESANPQSSYATTPDGRSLIFGETAGGRTRLWIAPLDSSRAAGPALGKAELLLDTPDSAVDASISPDGHWMAYASPDGLDAQVYVRPFPPTPSGGKWQISSEGGRYPVWSRAGREILFSRSVYLFTAGYRVEAGGFVAEKPVRWPGTQLFFITGSANFDLTPDGKQAVGFFDFTFHTWTRPFTSINFLLNFGQELRRRSPGA